MFLLFVLLAQCPKHATTSFVLLTVSLSRADVRRLGVRSFANAQPLLVTDVPCLFVCVWLRSSVAPLHPSFCPLPADDNQISDTGASALAAALKGSQLNALFLGEYFEPFGD